MKKAILLLIIVISLLSLNAQSKDHDKLRKELTKWQQFRAEGVIQVNYQMFSLRKFFVLSCANNQIRIDIFEGGLFGATPEPLFSAYVGDYIALRSPMMPQLETMITPKVAAEQPTHLIRQFDAMFELYGDEIVAKHELFLKGTHYTFNKKYQLTQITNAEEEISVTIDYKRNLDPDKVVVNVQKSDIMTLMIDKMTYRDIEVIQLPPNITPAENPEQVEPDSLD